MLCNACSSLKAAAHKAACTQLAQKQGGQKQCATLQYTSGSSSQHTAFPQVQANLTMRAISLHSWIQTELCESQHSCAHTQGDGE